MQANLRDKTYKYQRSYIEKIQDRLISISAMALHNRDGTISVPSSYMALELNLIYSSAKGHFDTVKFLVEKGVNIHTHDDDALRLASEAGHLEIVKYLVEKGANVNAQNGDVICGAAYEGHLEIVKFLVEKGADIHVDRDWVLRRASENGHSEVVKFITDTTN